MQESSDEENSYKLAKLNWWQLTLFVIMLLGLVCTVLYFILTKLCSKFHCCKPKNPTQPKALRRKQRVRNTAVDLKYDKPARKARIPVAR